MRIRVDHERCEGHAVCTMVDPDLFPLDEVGYSSLVEHEVPPQQVETARKGVASCPERALIIEEG